MSQQASGAAGPRKRIGVLIVAYNAIKTLAATIDRIPPSVMERLEAIYVFDDHSTDKTYEAAVSYGREKGLEKLHVFRNERNLRYGGNQKRGYRHAIEQGLDIIVLLHGDGQYAPEAMPQLLEPLEHGEADLVMGSRMMRGGHPLRGGMPLYKFVGNKILTAHENLLLGTRFSEFHSGYRAYNCHALARVPFERCADEWHFDTEIIIQFLARSFRIVERPIPTYYGDEICYVNGLAYAWRCIESVLRYRLHRAGWMRSRTFEIAAAPRYAFKSSPRSSHGRVLQVAAGWPRNARILEVGTAGGYLGRALREQGFAAVDGIERDPRLAGEAHPHYRMHHVVDLEREADLTWLGQFDLVICADVLEHLREPLGALRRLCAVLAPSGRMVVSLPNAVNWIVRLMVLAGRFEYADRGLLDRGHLRFFTRRTARQLLEEAGLRIGPSYATPLPLGDLAPGGLLRSLASMGEILYYGLTVAWKTLFAYQFVFVVERPGPVKVVRLIGRLNIGGHARQAVFLARALNGSRFDSRLVTGVPEPDEGDMGYLAAEQAISRSIIPELRRSLHPWRDVRAFWRVWRLLRQEQPDILHTHTAKAGALGRSAGWLYNAVGRGWRRRRSRVLLVHTFHGHVLWGYFGGWASRLFTWIERRLARATDQVIAVSEAAKRELLQRKIVRPEQITVIPLGFDLEALLGADRLRGRLRQAHRFGDAVLVGMVGRLVPIKQPEVLLRAADWLKSEGRLSGVQYVFVGDGGLRQELERLAQSLELSKDVTFLGWRRDLPEVYADLDVVCLTSRNEGLPAALIEAMAAGKPVVATDVGGVRELVSDAQEARVIADGGFESAERGILVRSADAEGLARAIAWLVDHPEERRRMGEAGRGFANERFTEERLLRDIERLYQQLLTEHGAGGNR